MLTASAEELRFHVLRLGSRTRVARMYGVRALQIYNALPVVPFDHYRRGMMVSIGGIMAKKCLSCGTARELERFWANPSAKSGCRETCDVCRQKSNEAKHLPA